MAFKQREKRRRIRMAQAAQGRAQRAQRQEGKSSAWWLTIVSGDICCAACSGVLRVGRPMVYRASPREALCVPCADGKALSYRPSTRWAQQRRGA